MFAIGNDELDKLNLIVKEGDVIEHTNEDGTVEDCVIGYGINASTGEKDSFIGFYKTKAGTSYLASLKGKLMSRPNLRLKTISKDN